MKNAIRAAQKSLSIETEGALRGRFYCRVSVAHSPEDVINPAYFGDEQLRQRLREGDVIEVEPEDLSWSGELTVRALLPQSREVLTRWRQGPVFFDQNEPAETEDGLFSVEWKGPVLRWCVFAGDERRESHLGSKTAAIAMMNMLRGKGSVAA